MTYWKQQESWKGRKRKEIWLILHCGKMQRRNTSCVGKAHGVLVFPAGILNALQWQQNIWERSSIFMEVAWIFYFRIMKVKLHKALFAIIYRRFVTGFTIT